MNSRSPISACTLAHASLTRYPGGASSTQLLPPPATTTIPNIPRTRPKSFQGFLAPGPNTPELILPHSVNPATLILH